MIEEWRKQLDLSYFYRHTKIQRSL